MVKASATDTRRLLLEAAAEEIRLKGFQAASLNEILQRTQVTKGALYHHFANKHALGHAVVKEIFSEELREMWTTPMEKEGVNPIDYLIGLLQMTADQMTLEELALGCPINNLSQEMSPVDDEFRQILCDLYAEWRESLAKAFSRGQEQGYVSLDLDVDSAAAFIVASLEGCLGLAKNAQSKDLLMLCGGGLIGYLNSIRSK